MVKWNACLTTIRRYKFTSSYKKIKQRIQKRRYELIDDPIKLSHGKFIRNDLALKNNNGL